MSCTPIGKGRTLDKANDSFGLFLARQRMRCRVTVQNAVGRMQRRRKAALLAGHDSCDADRMIGGHVSGPVKPTADEQDMQ